LLQKYLTEDNKLNYQKIYEEMGTYSIKSQGIQLYHYILNEYKENFAEEASDLRYKDKP